MTLAEKTYALQTWAGLPEAKRDSIYGNETADAIMKKAGLIPVPIPPSQGMKVCVDAGHGMGNRNTGVYDPGCVFNGKEEATIALEWAYELARQLQAVQIPVYMTRKTAFDSCPVGLRASFALSNECTHFISIHVNDADSTQANGTETLYNDDLAFATKLQRALLQGLGLNDRGVKQRPDLAVLKFKGQAALLELGFIKNSVDRAVFTDPAAITATCKLIVEALR